MKTHNIKCWPEYFERLNMNQKRFEVRKNDRDYQVGDFLTIENYDPSTGKHLGECITKKITYILHGGNFGIKKGYVVMQLEDLS